MKAIRATDIAEHVMIGPPIKFDEKGQNVGIPSAAVQNRNRTPTVVLPAAAATMTPVLPMPGWQGRVSRLTGGTDAGIAACGARRSISLEIPACGSIGDSLRNEPGRSTSTSWSRACSPGSSTG